MKLFKNFNQLSKGVKRIFIAGTTIFPFLIGLIIASASGDWDLGGLIFVTIILGLPIYWLLVLLISWVYVGFKD